MSRPYLTLIAITSLGGCVGADEPMLATTVEELEGWNGQSLNGQSLNGQSLNGQSLNGESVNGPNPGFFVLSVSLDGVVLSDGRPLNSTTLTSSVFSGTSGGTTYTGAQMIGAQFHATRGDGSSVTLRIDSLRAPVPPSTATFYGISYLEQDGQWYPTCKNSVDGLMSVALNGTWNHELGTHDGGAHSDDPTKFTLSCETIGALAKCVSLGYEPWRTINGVQLAQHHQACVRLLRADYCGNGISYTTNGMLLNLYDGVGFQSDTNTWGLEAEWDADGARCITEHHRSTVAIPCYEPELAADCGNLEHFGRGALLMDELP
jgi:hypothetical protein